MTRSCLALAFFCGCSPQPMTEALISSDFSEEDIETIVGSVDEWCSVSADSCFRVSVVPHGQANVVRFNDAPSDWVAGKCAAHNPNSGHLEFLASCEISTPLVLHELGHALRQAPGHLNEPGTIMNGDEVPFISCLTERDARFICERRGCAEWRGTCAGE